MKRLLFVLLFVFLPFAVAARDSGVTTTVGDDPGDSSSSDSEENADEKPVVKQTIVVTATRSQREISNVPVSTTVIDEEEIESTSAIAVDDLLRTVPGIHMPLGSSLVTHPAGERFSMRGLGGSRALVLYDGVPMHDAHHGTVEWDKVPLESIEQIEIVRGGSASLFGNYALGGTVNILTRPVDSNAIRLDLSSGSFDTIRAALTVDYMARPTLGLRLSHYRIDSDGYYIAVDPRAADVPVWSDTAITTLRADFRRSERTTGSVKLSFADIDMSRGTILTETGRDIFDVSTSIHHAVGDRGIVSTTLFHKDEDLRDITSVNLATGGVYLSSDSSIPATVLGGSIDWSTNRDGAISFLSAGIDLQDLDADESRQAFAQDGTKTEQYEVHGRQRFAGLFGQASWNPSDRVEVLASARVDYYENIEGSEVVLGVSDTRFPETSTTQLDPRVSFRYEIADRSAFRAAAYRAFNAPKMRELYRNAQTGNTFIMGNPYLEPETLVGAEIGFDHATTHARFTLNAYWSEIDGFVLRGPVEGQPANVIQYRNVGKARSQGIEAMADVRLSRRWSVTAGYTYADSTIVSNPVDRTLEGKEVPEVVPHIGTLGVRYRSADGLAFDLRWRVLSTSYGEPENVRPAPAHRVLDFSVSRPVTAWLDLYASVNNAFDEEYFYVLTPRTIRATEPRNIMGGARIRVPDGWLGGTR